MATLPRELRATEDPALQSLRKEFAGGPGSTASVFDDDDNDTPSWLDVGAASWMNNSMVGNVIDAGRQIADQIGAKPVPGFSPYQHFEQAKKNYPDISDKDVYESDYFDSVNSPEKFDAVVNQVRREREREQTMANGGAAGAVAAFIAPNIDALALVPGASVVRGASLRRNLMASTALGAGVAAGQEAFAYGTQVTRDQDGIALAAAMGAMLGGGTGLVGHMLVNRKAAADLSEVARSVTPPPAAPLDEALAPRPQSASAAAVETPEVTWTNVGPVGKTMGWLQQKIPFFATPSSVAQHAQSNEARYALNRLVNLGLETDGVNAANAEDIQRGVMRQADVAMEGMTVAFRKANSVARVDADAFNREVYKTLAIEGYRTDAPYADHIEAAAQHARQFFADVGGRGIKAGVLPEELLQNYVPQQMVRHMILQDEAGFRELMLRNIASQMDEGWLAERYGVTRDQLDTLEPEKRNEITQAWGRANAEVNHARAEAQVEYLESQLKQVRADLAVASRAWRSSDTADRKITARISETFGRTYETWLSSRKLEKDTTEAERQFFLTAAEALRSAKRAREEASLSAPKETDPIFKAWSDWQKASGDLENFWANPRRWKPSRDNAEIRHGESKATRFEQFDRSKLEKLVQRQREAEERFRGRLEKPAATDPRLKLTGREDPATAFLLGRATELDRRLRHLDERMEQAKLRYDTWSRKKLEAEQLKEQIRIERENLKALRETLAKTAKETDKALKQAKRTEKTLWDQPSDVEYVDQLVDALGRRDVMPSGLLLDPAGEKSARAKFRAIKIKPELMDEFLDRGFLSSNMEGILRSYSRDVGGRIGLSEAFAGDHTLKETRKKVRGEYDRLIAEAKTKGDTKLAEKLQTEKNYVDNHIGELREVVLGKYEFAGSSAEEWLMWFGRQARTWNYVAKLGMSAIPASLPDLATVSLQNGVMKTIPAAFGRNIGAAAKEMSSRELALLLYATENVPLGHISMGNHGYNVGGDIVSGGVGTSRLARNITGNVERGMNWMADKMSTVNLQRFWNGRLKFVAGHGVMMGLLDAGETLAKGGKLSKQQLRDAMILGLDEHDLKQFHELTQRYGEEVVRGFKMPLVDEWSKAGAAGRVARAKLFTALQRAVDRAVVSPGLGDRPLFTSKWWGKMLFQFQSFAFASINKFGRVLDDRIIRKEYGDAASALAWACGMGLTAYVLREGVIRNRWDDVEQTLKNPVALTKEIVDRGGFNFMLSPYLNSAAKIADAWDVPVKEAGLLPSKLREHNWLTPLFGPTMGLAFDVEKLVAPKDSKEFWRTAKRVQPYGNLIWWEALTSRF